MRGTKTPQTLDISSKGFKYVTIVANYVKIKWFMDRIIITTNVDMITNSSAHIFKVVLHNLYFANIAAFVWRK